MNKLNMSTSDYEIILVLAKGVAGYAFNKNVNPKVVEELQKAFEELNKEGTILKIRNAYIDNM